MPLPTDTVTGVNDTYPALDLLWPVGAEPVVLGPDPAETALTELYRPPRSPWLRATMVSTLDGASAGSDGRSGSINNPADHRVFRLLRGLADVIVVGAGTVRTEGYRAPDIDEALRAGRLDRGQAPAPVLAVVSRSGDVPTAALTGDPAPWVFTTQESRHIERLRDHLPDDRLHIRHGSIDLGQALTTLADAGLTHQLTEGGPNLLASLLAAGLVDELCLTWSPLVLGGSAARIVDSSDLLDPAVSGRPAHLLHADGVLLGRWLLERTADTATTRSAD